MIEVKRFNSTQKSNIFGNETAIFHEPDLTNKDNLTGYDKKLIGEFIRRNHARLAHEISLGGLIGHNKQKIEFATSKLSPLYRQLSGILARSHGVNVRDTFTFLEEIANEGWRNPDDINIIYLMVVLRIADYIQIDNHRVNQFLLKLKAFNSPISKKENQAHLEIKSVSFNQPDNERIFVLCNPSNSEMYVKLDRLINDIQLELDISWAILGEVYGFLPNNIPCIKFRRISSNLNDPSFIKKLSFVPKKIRFEVNSELSKLLVGPLYGNDPIFGVRELIQNSVDACIERNFMESKNGNSHYIPQIIVSVNRVNEYQSQFRITDNGKGMTINEILHYFLNVGSSFRRSFAWKKEFIDEEGYSLINRNGKFGIGVLASFLIGDEISVETIHHLESIKYVFSAKIDSDFIQIQKQLSKNSEYGTTIALYISNPTRDKLFSQREAYFDLTNVEWNEWYIYDDPKIEYYIDGKKQSKRKLIDRNRFHSFNAKQFEKIEWMYPKNISYSEHKVYDSFIACNGIIIRKELEDPKCNFVYANREEVPYVIIQKPNILIEDKEGIFPLKLDRNDIDCIELPFEEELLIEVAKEFIYRILNIKINPETYFEYQHFNAWVHKADLIFSRAGFSLDFDFFIDKLKTDYTFIRVISNYLPIPKELLDFKNCFIIPERTRVSLAYFKDKLIPEPKGRVLLKKHTYNLLFSQSAQRMSSKAKKNHIVETRNNDFIIFNYMKYDKSNVLLNMNYKIMDLVESIQEIDSAWFTRRGGTILNTLLDEYIGDNVVIPYNIAKRERMFSKAFSDLKPYKRISGELNLSRLF